jgi:hypothetical protein
MLREELEKTKQTIKRGLPGAIVLFIGLGIWGWIRAPKPPTIKVTAINYQRSEYTAVKHIKGIGDVQIVARCPGLCPASLGNYAAGPDSAYSNPDIISQQAVQ